MAPSHAQLRAAATGYGIDESGDYATLHARLGPHLVERHFSAELPSHVSKVTRGQTFSGEDLQPELVLHLATLSCTAHILTRLSMVCKSWRGPVVERSDFLWRKAAEATFPRVAEVAAASGSEQSWRSIYELQHRSAAQWKLMTKPKTREELEAIGKPYGGLQSLKRYLKSQVPGCPTSGNKQQIIRRILDNQMYLEESHLMRAWRQECSRRQELIAPE